MSVFIDVLPSKSNAGGSIPPLRTILVTVLREKTLTQHSSGTRPEAGEPLNFTLGKKYWRFVNVKNTTFLLVDVFGFDMRSRPSL
jgi:hypothetical protein